MNFGQMVTSIVHGKKDLPSHRHGSFYASLHSDPQFGLMSLLRACITLAVGLVITAGFTHAQSQFGTVVGTVTDPAGAAVPGVAVRATNAASQLGFSSVTNGSGDYVIEGLLPGVYTISGKKSGFADYSVNSVPVIAGRSVRTDMRLTVGSTTQTITVTASAAQLNTESATVAPAVPPQYLKQSATYLEWNQSVAEILVPFLSGQSYIGSRNIKSFGSQSYDRRISLDGAVFSDVSGGSRMPRGTVESLQQVSLDAGAEYQTAATSMMVTSKGTNTVHGAIWTEFQNPDLNALPYFQRGGRTAGTPSYGWGVNLGGPVYIPRLYNGHNKTFFLITTQDYHLNAPSSEPLTLPTAAMQMGDFSGVSTTIIDPTTGLPFPSNKIPSNRISSVAQNIINEFYPPASSPFRTGDYETGTIPYINPDWDFFARLDEQMGSKDALSASFLHSWVNTLENDNSAAGTTGGPPTTGFDNTRSLFNFFNVSENHIFGPSLLNEVNFGDRLGTHSLTYSAFIGSNVLNSMGLPQTPNAPSGITGGPTISITGVGGLVWPAQGLSDARIYTFRDNVSWIHGPLTTKMGFELIKQSTLSESYSNLFGTYGFTGLFTGNGWADFLLGLPSSTSRNLPPGLTGSAQHQWAVYVSENYHATSKLTLDLGLRFQYNSAATNPYSDEYYNFDLSNGDLVVPSQTALSNVNPGLTPSLLSQIVLPSAVHFPSHLVNGQLNVDPRLGFAYHVRGNTVVRGAWGRYGTLLANGAPTGGPFTQGVQNFTNLNDCSNSPCTPLFTLADPFPSTAGGLKVVSGLSVAGVNPNLQVPFTDQWNVTVEQRLPLSMVLRTSYVGSKSTHLPYRRNVDLPPPSTIPYTSNRLLYPNYFSVTYADSGGNSTYHSLDTELKREWRSGLTLDAGYTLAKCLTDDDEGGTEFDYGSFGPLGRTIEDPYNRSRDKGNCEAQPRQTFRTMWVLAVPVGQGRHWMPKPRNIGEEVLDKIAGGWTVSGQFQARTGPYFDILWTGFDAAGTGQTTIRANRICTGKASPETEFAIFNPACFTEPTAGSYGNSGAGIIEGLGYWELDGGIYKYFAFSSNERFPKLRVSAQSINILNHPTKGTLGSNPYIANNPAGVVAVRTSSVYSSGVSANLGDWRQFFLEARIEW